MQIHKTRERLARVCFQSGHKLCEQHGFPPRCHLLVFGRLGTDKNSGGFNDSQQCVRGATSCPTSRARSEAVQARWPSGKKRPKAEPASSKCTAESVDSPLQDILAHTPPFLSSVLAVSCNGNPRNRHWEVYFAHMHPKCRSNSV